MHVVYRSIFTFTQKGAKGQMNTQYYYTVHRFKKQYTKVQLLNIL